MDNVVQLKSQVPPDGRTLFVNLLGGPGSGKSTLAAATFSFLKFKGVNAELVNEWVKSKVWSDQTAVLSDQLYVFAKQNNRMHILEGKVEVAVTDSPIFLSLYYGKHLGESFEKLVVEQFNSYRNLNIFLVRTSPYQPHGRIQDEAGARVIDGAIERLLLDYEIKYEELRLKDIWAGSREIVKMVAEEKKGDYVGVQNPLGDYLR